MPIDMRTRPGAVYGAVWHAGKGTHSLPMLVPGAPFEVTSNQPPLSTASNSLVKLRQVLCDLLLGALDAAREQQHHAHHLLVLGNQVIVGG